MLRVTLQVTYQRRTQIKDLTPDDAGTKTKDEELVNVFKNVPKDGVDLHARNLYVCIINQKREIVKHKNIDATPEAL